MAILINLEIYKQAKQAKDIDYEEEYRRYYEEEEPYYYNPNEERVSSIDQVINAIKIYIEPEYQEFLVNTVYNRSKLVNSSIIPPDERLTSLD